MGCIYSKTCTGQIRATRASSVRQTHHQAPARGNIASTATATSSTTRAATEEEIMVFNSSSDETHQVSLSRDQEWGTTRLSRVSAPDGSRVVQVPSCDYHQAPATGNNASNETATSTTTRAGTEKENPVLSSSSDETHQLCLSRDQEWGTTRLSTVSAQDGSNVVQVPSCDYHQALARGNSASTATVTSTTTRAVTEEENPVFNSSSDVVEDEIHELSLSREQEWGISRLSRVSAPDGSSDYELRYSFLSQRGYYSDDRDKPNQDSFAIHTPFGSNSDHFFGVFDGHGESGAQCSQFVKKKLCENLVRNGRFLFDPAAACSSAFLTTNSQLHADLIDDSRSGTTAVTVMVRGRTIYVANAGDSRAVLAEKRDGDLVAVDLSLDQTPFRPDELERVKLCGARVLTLDQIEGLKSPDVQCWGTEEGDDGDPPRLWVPNGMYPGTAFTRSIGDSVAESIGVVANPEIAVVELTPDNPFFVIATDGVFEFISSQTVVDMVAKHKDPRDACGAIVAESYRLWLQYETRTDDITVIVVHINGLKDDAPRQLSSTETLLQATQGTLLQPPLPQVVGLTMSPEQSQ